MKKVIMFVFMIVLAGSVQVNAQSGKPAKKETAEVNKSQEQEQEGMLVKLKVSGITCAGCANHLYKVLSETSGVLDNSVEYPGDIAVIKYDPAKISPDEIIKTIEENIAYKAELYIEKKGKGIKKS